MAGQRGANCIPQNKMSEDHKWCHFTLNSITFRSNQAGLIPVFNFYIFLNCLSDLLIIVLGGRIFFFLRKLNSNQS